MYLSNKHMFFLVAPFLFSIFVFIFEVELGSAVKELFLYDSKYSNKTMESKIDLYTEIDKKYQDYKSYEDKIASRTDSIDYIVNDILYIHKQAEVIPVEVELEAPKAQISKEIVNYRLELLYPKDKVAIINGVIVREGSSIGDTKVLSIKEDSVLIKNEEGERWLYLFK